LNKSNFKTNFKKLFDSGNCLKTILNQTILAMNTKKNKNITTFDEILDKKYGKKGSVKREKWEQEFEAFKLGVLLEEARLKLGMTQEELAEKCGTNKSYISRIENNASDIRLSTLMKIVQTGLGGHLTLTLQI
jgi:DNA-binding XRE family transcriptional regulator